MRLESDECICDSSGDRQEGAPRIAVLDWTELPEWAVETHWDLVVASDVAYDEDCFAPLIDCLSRLALSPRQNHAGTKVCSPSSSTMLRGTVHASPKCYWHLSAHKL